MIPVFDLHADISEVMKREYNGSFSALEKNWMPLMKQGGIAYSSAASFFAGSESWEEMMKTVETVRHDIEMAKAHLILSADDLEKETDQPAFMMTVEGMCGIDEDVEDRIEWLYEKGNRIGSLAWNDENALATGNYGNVLRGLSEKGVKAVKEMNRLHMIIDVSHANEKTFWDIMDASEFPVIATHSNAKSICTVERNLTNQQIKAIAAKGGLIGMNACDAFISDIPENRNAGNLARHARYIVDMVGVEHVACGFDYGAYYNADEHHDLKSPEETQNFIEGLRKYGFSEDEIKDIAYRNVLRFLKKYL